MAVPFGVPQLWRHMGQAMMGRTHIVSAQVAWLAVAPQFTDHGWHLAIGTLVAGAAALGPDIDHGGSTASHLLFWFPDGVNRVGHFLFGVRRRRMGDVIGAALGGHRNGAHSVASMFAVFLVSALLTVGLVGGWWLCLAITLGWTVHIVGDCLTEHGVALLWPYTKRRFRLATINTGGGVEFGLRALLNVAVVVLAAQAAGVDLIHLLQPLTQ